MVEMTDEEYNAYETRQKAFQESEQGQKELKEHAEWNRKREVEEEEESRSNTIKESIEGGKNDPIENTNSSLGIEPDTHPEAAPVHSEHFEATVSKAKSLESKRQRGADRVKQDLGLPTSRDIKPTPAAHQPASGDPFAAMNADTTMGYGKPTPDRNEGRTYTPYEGTYRKESINAEVFDMMNADSAQHNTSNIGFGDVNAGGSKVDELAAKKKQIADYQRTQPSMEKEIQAKQKENRDKKTLEEYKTNRSSVGKVMDLFSREHAQEIGYAAEKKVEAHLRERRAAKEIEARKKTEPLLIQNDQNLKSGKINEAMHADREKKYLEKMERSSIPIEQKVGGAVKREANSAFGILNEVMTSPEKRKELKRAGVPSEFENNTISATFARGVASTTKQLQENPAKSQPMIFTRGSVAPAFVGAETHRLPTSSSFYGVVPSARQPRGTKGAKGKAGQLTQKSGNPINFGASAPIAFGGAGFGLFGRGQPAPTPPPPAAKPHARKKR